MGGIDFMYEILVQKSNRLAPNSYWKINLLFSESFDDVYGDSIIQTE